MTLVVDASVVVKWYVPEDGSAEASALLDRSEEKLAPDLLAAEFGNVLWKKVRAGELAPSEAQEIASAFVSAPPVLFWPSATLLSPALEIALRYGRTVYDSIYLAIALAEGCPVVTADTRLVQALKGTELEGTARLVSELAEEG
jgi:predicted nucleic acid-binding protein